MMQYTLYSKDMNSIILVLDIYTTVLGGARWTWEYGIMGYELSDGMERKENWIN